MPIGALGQMPQVTLPFQIIALPDRAVPENGDTSLTAAAARDHYNFRRANPSYTLYEKSLRGLVGTRYSIYCLLSLVSAAIFAIYRISSAWPVLRTPLLPLFLVIVGSVSRSVCFPEKTRRPSHTYCILLSAVLVSLGQIAIIMQRYSNFGHHTADSLQAQTLAIHFGLSFLVLSESELYRLYFEARGFQLNGVAVLETFLFATIDPAFRHSRETFGYLPQPWHSPPTTSYIHMAIGALRDTLHFLPAIILFHLGLGCLNYPLRRMFNPDPAKSIFLASAFCRDVLLTSDNRWVAFLGWLLLRPMRLLNMIIFRWLFADLIEELGLRLRRREDDDEDQWEDLQ